MGEFPQDVTHIFCEAEVKKTVSLIDDYDLNSIGFEDALLEIINDSSGGTNDDVRPSSKDFGLLLVIDAANDLGQAKTGMAAYDFGIVIDL
jgi:hypothetical protein